MIFWLLYISACSLHVNAQIPANLNFKHLTTENGLSQGVVDHILKDSKGFMWFTSHDGINRFDGTTCLSNEQIGPGFDGGQQTIGLVGDDKGNIWTGTSSGLLKFSYQTGRFQKIAPQIMSPDEKEIGTALYNPKNFADGYLLVYRNNIPNIIYHTLTNETRLIPDPYLGANGEIEKRKYLP